MSIIYEYVDPVLKEAFARKESGVDVYGGISAPRDEPETLLDHLVQEISGTPFTYIYMYAAPLPA